MIALALTFATLAAWWLIGLALLLAIRANVREVRIVLTAPALGSAVTMLPLFVLSHAGVAMQDGAPPVVIALLLVSLVILVVHRPRLPRVVAPVIGVCAAYLLLVARPMLTFGFNWVANANDDMANYVLSATKLLHHGLLTPFDAVGVAHDRDYPSTLQGLHTIGARPGADITLAGFSAITGRPPYELFMPMIFALSLCLICAVAALAMQAARRPWAAVAAAALVAASPLTAFGVLQQLLPQVWGLGLAAALFALLMRPEMHRAPGPRVRDLVPVAVLTVALIVGYIELAATVAVAYGLYVALLAFRGISLRAIAKLWGAPLVAALVVVNTYLFSEISFVAGQVTTAVGAGRGGGAAGTFAYTIVPAALPAILGLQVESPSYATPYLGISIFVAIVLLLAIVVACVLTARRGVGAAVALLADVALGILLWRNASEFGLFKLYMYVQPFLAAAVAVWLSGIARRSVLACAGILLIPLIVLQLHTEARYVAKSRDPIDLHHASAPDLLPRFRAAFHASNLPMIAVTENPTLGKLEAASVGTRPLHFVSGDLFPGLIRGSLDQAAGPPAQARYNRMSPWKVRPFVVLGSAQPIRGTFGDNVNASRLLTGNRCVLALPTGSVLPLNRLSRPEGSPDLITPHCGRIHNFLVFTSSSLGQGFYTYLHRNRISFYQLEPDYFYPGRTFAGLGRYVLFRVLSPSRTVRLELNFTNTLRQDGSNLLPPAVVVGATRVRMPFEGRGSGRVISPPLRPRMISGQPYVLLDMGVEGRVLPVPRPGLQGLYGRQVPLDPRYLTGYLRDASVMGSAEYRRRDAPSNVSRFPADLANPRLEYSGIYEDGWVAEDLYAVLSPRGARELAVRADVLPGLDQHLEVLVDGKRVASRRVKTGLLDLHLLVPSGAAKRRIELRWTHVKRLGPHDHRSAAARLLFLGFASPPSVLARLPQDLSKPGLSTNGVYRDAWLQRRSTIVLAGGGAGTLVLRAQVPPLPGGRAQRLRVLVDGRPVASQLVQPGLVEVRAPVAATTDARSVALVWAGAARPAPNDPRLAAARLTFLGVVPVHGPKLVRFPADLAIPGLSYSGIYKDGWAQKDVRVVLAGGPGATLTVTAQTALKGQHVEVVVDGRPAASTELLPGPSTLRIPLTPTGRPRVVEFHFARAARIASNDPRPAATLLQTIAVEAAGRGAPAALRLPGDLAIPGLSYSGIYKDGWAQKDVRVVLAGGPGATLTVTAQTALKGQHVEVVVDGRPAASTELLPGPSTLRIPLTPTGGPRVVEFHFARTARIAANDPRPAATLLQTIAVSGGVGSRSAGAPRSPRRIAAPGLRASLSAAQEVPLAAGTGTGTFTATLNGATLRWRLAVKGLSGPVVAAVIRSGAAGQIGARLVALCQPCTEPAAGTAHLTSVEVEQLRKGATYVNVGTPTNPSGEIRGQLTLR